MEYAGNLPDSEVFSRPESFGFGRDGLVRKAGRMAYSMYSTSRHLLRRLNNGAVGIQSQYGAETMTITTPKKGTITLGTTPSPVILVRRLAIETALITALFHVKTSDTMTGIELATGRASRAATMLQQACAESKVIGGEA